MKANFTTMIGYYAKQGKKRYLKEDGKWTQNVRLAKIYETLEDCLEAIKSKRTAYAVKTVHLGYLKKDPSRYETENQEIKC